MWRWEDVRMWGCEGEKMRRCKDEHMWRWEDVKMWGCKEVKMWRWEDVKMWRWEDQKMWRWEDVKMRRCEDEKMWRCEDVKMWGWEYVKMRRCEDEMMWRCEDVKMWRCEDVRMWRCEGVKMRICEDVKMWGCEDVRMWRWEDVKMWGCEDVRMWKCEDVRMWRWEDVKMWGCEDEKMWRWEDVKMWGCADEKMWGCEDVRMWGCEDVKMRRCEDVKMWGCEGEKMWRCEDVTIWGCEVEKVLRWKMLRWENVRMRRCEDEKMRRCDDEKMWGWEEMRRCEDEKMFYRPPLLEEPCAQTLSGKNCWQITIAALMQPLQYDLQCPAANDNRITHAAGAPSNLDAASAMRFAASRGEPACIYAQWQQNMTIIKQPLRYDLQLEIQQVQRTTHTWTTTRCRTPRRNRLTSKGSKPQPPHTHKVQIIAVCSHFKTEKRTVSEFCAPASSPTQAPQHSCSHYNAFCSTTYTSMQPLQMRSASPRCRTPRRTDSPRNDPNRNRRTHKVPLSIAACSHFTRKNARFRAPASSPKPAPCSIHAAICSHYHAFCSTSMQPFQCDLMWFASPRCPSSPPSATLHGKMHGFVVLLHHHFPSSPLPLVILVTTSLSHLFPSSTHPLGQHFP